MLFVWSLLWAIVLEFGLFATVGILELIQVGSLNCSTVDVTQTCQSFTQYLGNTLGSLMFINVLTLGLPTFLIALVIFATVLFARKVTSTTPISNRQ